MAILFTDNFDHYDVPKLSTVIKPPPKSTVVIKTPFVNYIGPTPVTIIMDEDSCQIIPEYLP